jgi:hypothetical protein
VRNATLQATIYEFTADSALQLTAETQRGSEVPFEIIETEGARIGAGTRGGRVPLYCYRPLTGSFIRDRLGLLANLPSYAAASRALAELEGAETYLRQRGEQQVPDIGRERADAVLHCFLARVFEERTEFGLDETRFALAYDELEHALYDGRSVTTVIASLFGMGLDPRTSELALGDGLSLMHGTAIPGAPDEAVWGTAGSEARSTEANVLLVLSSTDERGGGHAAASVPVARVRFRRVLTALRLFERGGYSLGPIIWTRTDGGAWRPIPFGSGGTVGGSQLTLIGAAQEDELRAFCNLIARRIPDFAGRGEVAWALTRFEFGCERAGPLEALTDYLLALRALLEPEGPSSGRLAQRLAVICARPAERPALAERVAHAISLERAVIAGLTPEDSDRRRPADRLVDELAEHLRALLRDVICGHLDPDLCAVADELVAEAAASV